MRELRLREAPQIAHHHQDVLVDGIDVEEVVLHLSHDAAELRQVPAEDAVLIHAPELVHDAARLLQDVQEHEARERVLAKTRIDPGPRAVKGAQRAGGHAAQLLVLHHEQEALEDRERLARERVLALDVQQLTAHLEALVQRARLGVRPRREPRLQVLQEDGIELRHAFCRLVVTLHHRFARAPVGAVGEAHLLGERRLHVEHQAILAPSGEVM